MNVIVFDTETTGVPKNYNAKASDVDNWPRVIQLSWQLIEFETQKVLSNKTYLITPYQWVIPKEKFWIDNGFSTEKSLKKGTPMRVVLNEFVDDMHEADILVCHNVAFDKPIVQAEMIRYSVKPTKRERQTFCTMQSTIQLCKIPFAGKYARAGNYKFPKLVELYKFLFGREMVGNHQADSDVAGTAECFFELVKRGIIKPQILNDGEKLSGTTTGNETGGKEA